MVDLKDRRIDNLTEIIQTQAQKIDCLTIQLGNDQKDKKSLSELLTQREKELKQLKATQKKLTRTKTYQQNRIANLKQENQTLKVKVVYYENQDKNLRQTIQDLQNQLGNHDCSANCSFPHLPAPHVCPIVQQVNCSHSDYDSLQNQLAEKERIIQAQAERIRELENKPPLVETKTQTIEKIKEVEKENNTPFGEDLAKIIKIDLNTLEKELGIELSSEVKEQIEKATNYQQLSSIRNQAIKSYLVKGDTTTIQPNRAITKPNQERVIWLSLLVISLLTIGGLLVRMKKISKKKNS